MPAIQQLFKQNQEWASAKVAADPEFFSRLSVQQSPEYLWIGCSDSRVPANEIVGLAPGEVFVHRNIANVVVHSDMNCLSVIQYAVDVLKVKYILVVGHYGCGGVKAAMESNSFGLIDNWLRHIKDVYADNRGRLDSVIDPEERHGLLCELNVMAQVANVSRTAPVQRAWKTGNELAIHGWIYGLADGVIKDLQVSIRSLEEVDTLYAMK